MYVESYEHIDNQQQVSELYCKLPKDIENMLVYMPANINFETMCQNLSHIRYWQGCANEANTLADPMEVDAIRGQGDREWTD